MTEFFLDRKIFTYFFAVLLVAVSIPALLSGTAIAA